MSWGAPGLKSTCWWIGLVPDMAGCGSRVSWSWCQPTGDQGWSPGHPEVVPSSWWISCVLTQLAVGPQWSRACNYSLVGLAGARCSWSWCLPTGGQSWVLGSLAAGSMCPRAGVDLLVDGSKSKGWLWSPGCPGASTGHWWVVLGPGPSCRKDWVLGLTGAQGFLWQLACWLVGLRLHPAGCLVSGAPGLMLTSWGVGLGSSTNKLEGGFQMALASTSVFMAK